VETGSSALVLHKAWYAALINYKEEKDITDVVKEIRAGNDAAPLGRER
jgi:hypothetical protein